ncbi:SBF-like CPA transporter family-domain-containing protein [Dichotomocladium elegans]|nr:SBF-like CPA transporter family-domain-containing protein [Dichotomocladium elegans]
MNIFRLKSTASLSSEITIQPNQGSGSGSLPLHRPSPLTITIEDDPKQEQHEHQQSRQSLGSDKARKCGQQTKRACGTLLKKYWFLLGLAFVILLSVEVPDVARYGGSIHSEWSIKWGAVIIIFLISGLSLRTQTLAKTVIRIRLHLLVQLISLVIIPFFVFGLVLFFFKVHTQLNSMLLIGIVIAASTPTTVSSNVVMTKAAGGDEATALMNASLGNVLGIFISPALVGLFQHPLIAATPEDDAANSVGATIDYASVFKQLGLTIMLPLVVGQVIQWRFPDAVAKMKIKCRFSDISSIALLCLVWSVFSNAVYTRSFESVTAKDIVAVAAINAFLYIFFSLLCLLLAYLPLPASTKEPAWVARLRYSREDTVAVMYCGATKTVAMGAPLINVIFQNADPGALGVLLTPLLLYHVEQLILGNIEVDLLSRWIKRGKRQKQDVEKQAHSGDEAHEASASNPTAATAAIATAGRESRDEEESDFMASATRIGSSCLTVPRISTAQVQSCSSPTLAGSPVTRDQTDTPTQKQQQQQHLQQQHLQIESPTAASNVSPPESPISNSSSVQQQK